MAEEVTVEKMEEVVEDAVADDAKEIVESSTFDSNVKGQRRAKSLEKEMISKESVSSVAAVSAVKPKKKRGKRGAKALEKVKSVEDGATPAKRGRGTAIAEEKLENTEMVSSVKAPAKPIRGKRVVNKKRNKRFGPKWEMVLEKPVKKTKLEKEINIDMSAVDWAGSALAVIEEENEVEETDSPAKPTPMSMRGRCWAKAAEEQTPKFFPVKPAPIPKVKPSPTPKMTRGKKSKSNASSPSNAAKRKKAIVSSPVKKASPPRRDKAAKSGPEPKTAKSKSKVGERKKVQNGFQGGPFEHKSQLYFKQNSKNHRNQINPKNTELQPYNKIDFHGVSRGSCKNCTECPQFISIPDRVLCAYCGCPPALHHKEEDSGGLDRSREDISQRFGGRSDTDTDGDTTHVSETDSTSSGVSSYVSRRKRGWRPVLQRTAAPSRVTRLLGEEGVSRAVQLDNAWNELDCSPNIYVNPNDPLTLHRNPSYETTDGIRGKLGYSTGLHIWEITWPQSSRGSHPVVGVALKSAPLSGPGYTRLIGSNYMSWGWGLKTKKIYHGSGIFRNGSSYPKDLDEKLEIPERFYMLLDMDRGTLSFQVDNDFLGEAFSGLKGLKLFPAVSTVWGHCEVTLKYVGSHELGVLKHKGSFPPVVVVNSFPF